MNPYSRLKEAFALYVSRALNREKVSAYRIPQADLDAGTVYQWGGVAQQVAAAAKLGWDTVLTVEPDGLHIDFLKRVAAKPAILY